MTLPASGPLSLNDIQGEFGGTNPIGMNEYYAGGGLVPPGTTGTYGAVPSSGALSVQNFYGTSAVIPVYIEEVFSTFLYTGSGGTRTITNGINLSGNGGLVWAKPRDAAFSHCWIDTARGTGKIIYSDASAAQATDNNALTAFNANGYSMGGSGQTNSSGTTYASWTFRKQPKFFDVVTYAGNGATSRSISHSLGSKPGCIFIKATNDAPTAWVSVNRDSAGVESNRCLNGTLGTVFSPVTNNNSYCNLGNASTFNVTSNFDGYEPQDGVGRMSANQSGVNYVAYVFAHNAGGFGLTGTDNVISCGDYTVSGNVATVTLGYEPQWTLTKRTNGTDEWRLIDVMRGSPTQNGQNRQLYANLSDAEGGGTAGPHPTATGFTVQGVADGTYIYIAIRRGPMKVPTTGTSVFQPVAYTGTGSTQSITGASFPPSLVIGITRNSGIGYGSSPAFIDSLRGVGPGGQTRQLFSSSTSSELTTTEVTARTMTGITLGSAAAGNWNFSGSTYVAEMFQRAPGFFDEVCYTGNGPGTQVVNHNLTVVPELVINKVRSTTSGWTVFQGSTTALTGFLRLNDVNGQGGDTLNVSATTITVDSTIGFGMNTSGATYVTYLFATCPGVSKVGRYTGTGTTQVINCGFSAGSRFVMIKRFNSTGPWYVWDSARGIVAGNDPYLLMNSENAEVTGTDYVDTAATGFEISSTAPAEINASGSTFIFLAIA
jgi:hypothetical protein